MSPSGPGDGAHERVVFILPGGGRVYGQGGFRGAIKVDDEEAGGSQCFSEWTIDAGDDGPPPHLDREHREAFFVVEGTLSFRAARKRLRPKRGPSSSYRPASSMRSRTEATRRPGA